MLERLWRSETFGAGSIGFAMYALVGHHRLDLAPHKVLMLSVAALPCQGRWVELDFRRGRDGVYTVTSSDIPELNLSFTDPEDHIGEILDAALNWIAITPATYRRIMARGPQDV